MKMIYCKDCHYRAYKDVSVFNEDWLDQPKETKCTHLEPKLHCAFYPEWKQVEFDHYCGKGIKGF